MHRAIQLGVNFFDVANVYMDGVSEEVLGKALGPKRKQIVLASKAGRVRMGPQRKLVRDSSPREIHAAIDASLRRLGTDWIDHYQIDWPDPDTRFEDTFGAMRSSCRRASSVPWASATSPVNRLRGHYAPSRSSPRCSRPTACCGASSSLTPSRSASSAASASCRYWPLEQGVLTGRYTRANPPKTASPEVLAQLDVVQRLRSFADTLGRPLAQAVSPGCCRARPLCRDPRRLAPRAARRKLRRRRLGAQRRRGVPNRPHPRNSGTRRVKRRGREAA